MKNAIEDIKTLRNWAIGIAGFATTISAILIQVFHFKPEPTIAAVVGFALLMLLVVFLIDKSETRTNIILRDHIEERIESDKEIAKRFDSIDACLLDIQRSSLRIELGNEIKRHPENHDTILKMAERYFLSPEEGGLRGDWYMSSVFLEWAEKENIKLPKSLVNVCER